MQITMYQASVPRFIHMLGNLNAILAQAQAHAQARKIDESAFTGFRLAPDMLPFTRQVMIATDTAKGCAARLAGVTSPVYEDTEKTLDELQARVAKTIAYLQTFKPEQIDGSEEKEVTLKRRDGEERYQGLHYLQWHAIPNFYFHVSMAYAILRHNGVEIGKRDFLGNP
jgi:hypothetical protein